MSQNGKLIGALILGAAAGATLGVLFAPDKGSNTRKKISRQTEDLINQLSKKVDEGKDALSDLQKKAGQKADKMKNKMTGKMEEEEDDAKSYSAHA